MGLTLAHLHINVGGGTIGSPPPSFLGCSMTTKQVTDYDIQALVDNELSWENEKRVWDYIQSNREAKKRYEELCRQKKLLQSWWRDTSQN